MALLRYALVRDLASLPLFTLCAALTCGCGKDASDPFTPPDADPMPGDGGGDDAPDAEEGAVDDSGQALGKPCLDDSQCDDSIGCTGDRCDQDYGRCRNTPDDLACQNDRYCDGVELCDAMKGCIAGDPVTCSDFNSCTIDRCLEDELLCAHDLRDADGDGDPDYHCGGGADCNDVDPLISSLVAEVCANSKDDDCDGEVDESGCVAPAHDTCSDAFILPTDQQVELSTQGTMLDYSASCVPTGDPSMRDLVAAVTVPGTEPMDVDLIARADSGQVYIAAAEQCSDPSTELGCGASWPTNTGSVSRFIARAVPPSTFPIYLFSNVEQKIRVEASLRPAQPPPSNETCGTALPIVPGQPATAVLVGVTADLPILCTGVQGDLVYTFTTTEAHDVFVSAASADGFGDTTITLRDVGCALGENELGCTTGSDPFLFRRAIPAGTWFVSVSANAPTTVVVNVELAPPSDPPADETCLGAPEILPNQTRSVSLTGHMDDVFGTCMVGAPDAAYRLELDATSDVLLVGRISQGDYGAVSLFGSSCLPENLLACGVTSPSPVRTSARNQAPGTYHAVIETMRGNPTQLTAFVRPATPPTVVTFADECADAIAIPQTGGLFQGNTKNATAQYPGSCDQGGSSNPQNAPEQVLRLELSSKKRVIFDMRGSAYRTMLDVRRGPACPGTAITSSCAVGYYEQRSYLDLTLEPGTYFAQVDGFAGESGAWFLDVFVVDP